MEYVPCFGYNKVISMQQFWIIIFNLKLSTGSLL